MPGPQSDPLGILTQTTQEATPPQGSDPLGILSSKKKDEPGASTSSSTVQLPGFVQQQQLDLNAAPSSSPSTIPSKPKIPAIVYNQNLYTGKPSPYRGAFNPTTSQIMEAGKLGPSVAESGQATSGPVTYNWEADANANTVPQTPTSAVDTLPGHVDTQSVPVGQVALAYDIQLKNAKNFNTQIAVNTPGTPENLYANNPGVAQPPPEQSTLDYSRELFDYYNLSIGNTSYRSYIDRERYYQDQRESLNQQLDRTVAKDATLKMISDNELELQRSRASHDVAALGFYNSAVIQSAENDKDRLDKTYGAQLATFDDLTQKLNDWPKDPQGKFLAITPEDQNQLSAYVEGYNALLQDQGFMQALDSLNQKDVENQKINASYQQVVKDNPLFFAEQNKAQAAYSEAKSRHEDSLYGSFIENIQNPVVNAVVDFGVGLLYVPKALGAGDEYGWTDELYDKADLWRRADVQPYTPVGDGILPKTVSAATTMALMYATGMGLGTVFGGTKAALTAGQIVAGTVATMDGYYQAGIEAGMDPKDAERYSIVNGTLQGILEMVNPEAAMGEGVISQSANTFMDVLRSGASKTMALKESGKIILNNIKAETAQEFLQQFAEWGVNMQANQIMGTNLDTGKEWGKTLGETAVVTALLSGIVGGIQTGGIKNIQSRMAIEATYAVGIDPLTYRKRVDDMLLKGDITPETASQLNAKIDNADAVVKKLPKGLPPEKAFDLIPLLQEKMNLESQLKITDNAFHPKIEQDIQKKDEEIQHAAGVKTEEQIKQESDIRVAEMNELGDLELHDSQGLLTDEEKKRLEELKSKYPPTPEVSPERKYHAGTGTAAGVLAREENISGDEAQQRVDNEMENMAAILDKAFDKGFNAKKIKKLVSDFFNNGPLKWLPTVATDRINKYIDDRVSGKTNFTAKELYSPKPNNNATQERIITESDQQQHQNGNESGGSPETGDSNRNVQGGEVAQEVKPITTNESESQKAGKEAGKETEVLTPEEGAAQTSRPSETSQETATPPENAIDDPEFTKKLDDDLKVIKTLSASGVGQKAKAVDQRISKALKEGTITQGTADKYTKAFNDVVTGRVGEIKESANKKIDEATDKILKFGKNVGAIGPNKVVINGEEVPISKNSMLDLEALIKVSSDLLKRAASRGIDVQVAFGNMKAAIVNHPRYKRLIASGGITPEDYDKLVMEEYQKTADEIEQLKSELDQKQHRFADTFGTVEKFLDPILREEFKKNGLLGYIPQGMEMQWSDAGKFIEGLDKLGEIDHAIDVIKDMSNGMQAAVRVMIGNRILEHYAKKARAATTEEEKLAASKKLVSIMNIMEKAGEDVGRALGNYRKTKEIIMDLAGPEVTSMIVGEELKAAAEKEANTKSSKKEAKEISEEAKKIEGEIKSQEQKVKAAEKLLEAMRNKFNQLDDKGKRELAFKMIDELSEKGLLSARSVSKMYAEVLGEKLFTPEKQKFIREQAEIAQKYREEDAGYDDKLKALKAKYLEDIKGKSPSEVKDLTKKYRLAISDAYNSLQKHMFEAQMAHAKISKELQGPRDIYSTLRWGIRFGMLGIHSTVINVFSNAFMGLPRFIGGVGATGWDIASTPVWRVYGKKKGWANEVKRSHSLLNQILSLYQGTEATNSKNPFVRAASAIYGGLKPVLRELYYRTWKGVPDPAFMDKFNEHRNVKVIDAWIDLARKKKPGVTTMRDIESRIAALYEGTFGAHHVPIMRLMAAGDIVFKRPYYGAKLHEIATTRKDLKTDEEIADFMANPDAHSKAEATEWAKRQVFQQEKLSASKINKLFKQVNYGIDKIIEGASDGNTNEFTRHVIGMLSLVKTASFPFVSTMINMMPEFVTLAIPAVGFYSAGKKTIQAAGLYNKAVEIDRSTAQGQADYDKLVAEAGRKRNEAASDLGKGMVSMMIMKVALSMAARALITGKADDDQKKRNWEYMNIKPYSINKSAMYRWLAGDEDWATIRDTDEWVGYNQLGPIGTAMGAWATGYRTGSAMKSADSSAEAIDMLTGAFPEIMSQAMDMSFMKGTAMMVEGFTSGGDKFERWYNNTLFGLSTAIFPNDLGTFIKSRDEFMRDTKPAPDHDYHDSFLNRWNEETGNYEELPMKINAFGDPVKRVPEGVDPAIYMFMSPTRPYEINTESVEYQIYKTYVNLPEGSAKNAIVPSVVDWIVKVPVVGNSSIGVQLTAKEYELLQIVVGKERESRAKDYVFSDEWEEDSNQDRSEKLSKIWREAQSKAEDDFIESSPRMQMIHSGVPPEQTIDQ